MTRARASITLQLTLLFAAASAAVLIGVGVLVVRLVESHFEQQDLTELDGKLELVRHRLLRVRAPGDLDGAAASLADALVGHHDLALRVAAPDGRELFAAGHAQFPAALAAPAEAAAPPRPLVWRHDGRNYRGIVAAAATGIPGQPQATVAVALDIERHLVFLSAFRQSLALAIGGGIALTALLGWAAARRGLAPMRAMARVTQDISASRLGERLPLAEVPAELVLPALAGTITTTAPAAVTSNELAETETAADEPAAPAEPSRLLLPLQIGLGALFLLLLILWLLARRRVRSL